MNKSLDKAGRKTTNGVSRANLKRFLITMLVCNQVVAIIFLCIKSNWTDWPYYVFVTAATTIVQWIFMPLLPYLSEEHEYLRKRIYQSYHQTVDERIEERFLQGPIWWQFMYAWGNRQLYAVFGSLVSGAFLAIVVFVWELNIPGFLIGFVGSMFTIIALRYTLKRDDGVH